ncbi:cation:proton antiporter [Bacillus sp. HMF5848]|uniref:cation:proton antiporter n=1 Tax=Bacillus sp. HMF5848 TaxID=2495421 RepID=UPI000F77B61A|nr:cation:proton antiporter [Bacillus sp. HMF5848]RSK26533.1 cation:proton antiporter [Bacillus sp. HMF5848]
MDILAAGVADESSWPTLLIAGVMLLALFVAGHIGNRVIKIPDILLYIVLGIVVGGFIADHEVLHFASEVGIVLLFFLLGLEFPIDKLKTIAKNVWPAGLLDAFLNLGITTMICFFLGLDILTAFLIGGIVYATSSSITAQLLQSSKRMANTESEFILALLIFEDLVAPIVIALLIGFTSGEGVTPLNVTTLVVKIVLLTVGAIVIGKYVFRKLGDFVDRISDGDTFILMTIGIALAYGGLALLLGLSEVLGAFLAGMMLAETRRNSTFELYSIPIRNLFLPFFFLSFGTTISFSEGIPLLPLLLILIIWSVVAKIITGFFGGKLYGLSNRVALRAGLSLTSRGEFSVVIASLAVGSIKILASLYILATALIGIVLFLVAPYVTNFFFGSKPKKVKKKIQVPG